MAAGEKVEILSSLDVLISAPPKPNARAANKLSKILSDSRNQNLILQNSQDGEFLEGKANEILRTYDKSYDILQIIFGQISAARQYFIGRIPPPSVTDGCAISVPWTETQDEISEAIETLTVTDEINTDLNKLFKFKSDGTLKTNSEGKPYRPGGTREGTAILAVEASINAFKQKIDHLLLDLDNYLNNIELMMNGNVPGSFLVAFEQGTTCVKKATVDFTSV